MPELHIQDEEIILHLQKLAETNDLSIDDLLIDMIEKYEQISQEVSPFSPLMNVLQGLSDQMDSLSDQLGVDLDEVKKQSDQNKDN